MTRRGFHACALYVVTYVECMRDVGKDNGCGVASSAHMHVEPDAPAPPLPEYAGFVVVVTVRVYRRANALVE